MSTSLYAAAAALRDDASHTARLISCAAEQLQAVGQDPETAEAWVQRHRMALSITPEWPAKGAQGITDGDILSRIQPMVKAST